MPDNPYEPPQELGTAQPPSPFTWSQLLAPLPPARYDGAMEERAPREDDFWLTLEYRISREFDGMADKRLRCFWCDGFTPQKYFLNDPVPRIVGHAWMCEGQNQQEWEFTLFLRRTFPSREEINWPRLLPGDNVTCWVAMDIEGKRVQMEPAAAVPDFESPKKRTAVNRSQD